jgi:hypothetical protein
MIHPNTYPSFSYKVTLALVDQTNFLFTESRRSILWLIFRDRHVEYYQADFKHFRTIVF